MPTVRLTPPKWRRCSTRVLAAAAGVAAVLLAGCAGGEDAAADSATSGLRLRLVIPDGNLREPDVPCAGARGFRFAHAHALYVIEDPDGRQVASGTLPEGTAEKAFNVDLGEGRQPTVCVMMLDVSDVESLNGHALVIDDRAPVPITLNRSLGDIPEVVLQ
jgi:hypothetical protein